MKGWIYTAEQWNQLHKSIVRANRRNGFYTPQTLPKRLPSLREIRSQRSVLLNRSPVKETIDEEI